ncbi:asparagine synthase (glutamine-hydrolyzing) [Occallatibacter savannae]|uniref:asparagine synthase (glutamine-hydrolyzing) n=1 Tax=Occallatibacter savannae TaxID=1002691 RepID=UPI000D690C6E|nr:asparagine synthase (glutamine-hydrolyzing) [Occallatibacter savannae]
MCGIVGFTHCFRSLPAEVLTDALASLVHRGPDRQAGFTTSHVSMGAARLRIVDLDHGDQPMHSDDGSCTIVFNGEIYNHHALREELKRLGRRFRTECDTEVVLNGYLEWGNDCFRRLRGMFAVALWVEPEQRLVLARDRAGIKPLYYKIQDREIFFGSELKCIFAHPRVQRRLDLRALNCFLSLNYVPGPLTLVEGITKLMPGNLLEWKHGSVSIESYVPATRAGQSPRNLEEASEELDMLLRESVSEEVAAEVPMGIWLSGGLDSSTVLHYAAEHSIAPLNTFSITFRGKSFDEARYIRSVSEFYGTNHTELDLNEDLDLADIIQEMSYYSDEPGADAGAVPVWYLARMTRKSATVVLTGEGADELFGGYLTYQANRYRRGANAVPRPLLRGALRCARILKASNEKIGFDYKLKRFLQGALLSPEAAHVFWNGTFSEDEKRALFRYADAGPLAELLGQMRPGKSVERFLDFDQRYSLPDALLYKVDRMSMAHAIEARPPFLDERIVDFASRLPADFKIRGKETKVVLRHLMRTRLPRTVLKRPKIGLDIPIHEWFRGVLRPLLLENLNESSFENTGLFDWPTVRTLIDEHHNRKANWGYHLWGLLTLTLWMKRWEIEVPVETQQMVTSPIGPASEESSLLWQPASYSA